MKSVYWCVLVFSLNFVSGQDWVSVCPDVFEYENRTNFDLTHGRITVLKPDGDKKSVSTLEVRINFTIAGPIIDEYIGHVTATTTNLVRKYNRKDPLVYRVHFPRTELPPPKVTGVTINGFAVCAGPGDDPGLSKPITNLSIKHRSSDGTNTRVTSPPVTNTVVTNPLQPWPAVTSTLGDAGFSNTPITTDDECGVVAGGNERVPLIHNGKFYDRGEVPWLVAIYRVVENNLQFICAGTLVSDRHVVTAAHCMQRPFVVTPITEIVVKAGVHSLNDWGDDLTIIRKLLAGNIHEEYDPNTLQNDILILTLNKRVKSNRYIRPACLWSGDTELSRVVGASGVVAGWGDRGAENLGGKPDEPQMVRVPIVSTRECRASRPDFHQLTYNTTLCAGDRNGSGPCKGDSGGGLYLLEGGKWRLRGVVSVSLQSDNGARTCNLNEYVVYTDTAQYLPWIRNILSIKYYD